MGAVCVGVIAGVGVGAAAGWADARSLAIAAATAGAVWGFATLVGVQTLILGTGLASDRLGFGVLASSMARMLTALLVGVVVYFLVKPEGQTFWVCFLAAGLAALIAEAIWGIRTIQTATQSATRGAGAPMHGAA